MPRAMAIMKCMSPTAYGLIRLRVIRMSAILMVVEQLLSKLKKYMLDPMVVVLVAVFAIRHSSN